MSSLVWVILAAGSLVLCVVVFFASDQAGKAVEVIGVIASILLLALAIVSVVFSILVRNDNREAQLKYELQQKGFVSVHVAQLSDPSWAYVNLPGYPGGCRLGFYKDGNWLFDLGDMTRSVTTPKDMATWSSVKFACSKNPR